MKLADILYQKTNDQLKQLTQLSGECRGLNRKDDLVNCLLHLLLSPDSLRRLWQRLDELSQKAVAHAYHNEGEFNEIAFAAQYGSLPERPSANRFFTWQKLPILLDLFIYNRTLPDDLMPLLEKLAPPPDKFQLEGLAEAPQEMDWFDEKLKFMRAETERTGQHDLLAYLRLVAQGELSVTPTTGALTLAGYKKIVDNLLAGDFLPLPNNYRANQTIRPFGLDIFARGAGLVTQQRRSGLALTELGQQYYQSQEPELLLEAFECWSQTGAFDELTRIAGLRGLRSGQTRLTPPASRREAVIEALSWCPVNVWIDIEDFYRAVKIWHFDFEVELTQFTNLYIGARDYGTLYGEAYWRVVKGLYINALLWEYLGSMGAVDLVYTEPWYANMRRHFDYYDDNMDHLSLYDGLRYFRINPLGAYLLGQARQYTPSKPLNPPLFTISPDKLLTVIEPGQLTPNDEHLLSLMTVSLGHGRYRLDTQQFLSALEAGQDWQELHDFLTGRHQGPLPEEVVNWLARLQQNSQAFKSGGQALLIKVNDPALIELVLADPQLQKFCSQIDRRTLVVPANREKAFRSRLKALEYVLI
jgi:hypothetical protein